MTSKMLICHCVQVLCVISHQDPRLTASELVSLQNLAKPGTATVALFPGLLTIWFFNTCSIHKTVWKDQVHFMSDIVGACRHGGGGAPKRKEWICVLRSILDSAQQLAAFSLHECLKLQHMNQHSKKSLKFTLSSEAPSPP